MLQKYQLLVEFLLLNILSKMLYLQSFSMSSMQ
jgi:hypothetical protein